MKFLAALLKLNDFAEMILLIYKIIMTSYLAYSIYAYIGSLTSWRIEKMYRNQNDDRQIKTWLVLKNVFRVTGTALLIAHLLS